MRLLRNRFLDFSPQHIFAIGSLARIIFGALGAASTPGSGQGPKRFQRLPEGFGRFRCRYWCADTWWGSGGFWCRLVTHFCVHNSVLLVTKLLMNLRQATNMNVYMRSYFVLPVVGNCTWSILSSSERHPTWSGNHTNSIMQIQSRTYSHAVVLHAGKWIGVPEQLEHLQVIQLN